MDDNPYLPPQTAGGFEEELETVSATFELDKRLLKKEAYRLAELSGMGSFLAILVFFLVLVLSLIGVDELAGGPAHPAILLVAVIGCPIATHVFVNRALASNRIRRMEVTYEIRPGDRVVLEVSAGMVRFASDRVRWEWPMSRVHSICTKRDLTFVIDGVVTLPVSRTAECGNWDFASFMAHCQEQQRRYRQTAPFIEKLKSAFRRS